MEMKFCAAVRPFMVLMLVVPSVASASQSVPDPRIGWMIWTNIITLTLFFTILAACYGGSLFIWMKFKGQLRVAAQRIFFWISFFLAVGFLYVVLPFYILSKFDEPGGRGETLELWWIYGYGAALLFGPAVIATIGVFISRFRRKPMTRVGRFALVGILSHAALLGIYAVLVNWFTHVLKIGGI